MTNFFKLIAFLPFVMAAICFVAAMLNDKRDLKRRLRDDAADRAALTETDRPRWPATAFEPGSIR